MRLSRAQSQALRFGAVMALLGAVVLAWVALTVDSGSTSAAEVTVADDPGSIPLPAPGLFGSSVTVYGAVERGQGSPGELGCRLLDDTGHEQSRAKMSELKVLSTDPLTVDGATLQPLFSVRSYPSGSVIECTGTAAAAPIAVSPASTFGSNGLLVRAAAGAGALLFLVVGVAGWFVFRPRRD